MASQGQTTTEKKDDGEKTPQQPQTQETPSLAPARGGMLARVLPLGPFALMRQLFDDLEHMWSGTARRPARERMELAFVPDIEVSQREGKLIVKCDLPGLSPDDVEVTIQNDALVISGERRSEHEEQDEHTWRCERTYGAFRRVIPLPDGADPNTAEAKFENGVLEVSVSVPGEKETRGRKINIQAQQGAQTQQREKVSH